MTYHLYIGNRLYFSWSLAAYLMFERFGLADQVETTVFYPELEADVREMMADLAPARTLPTVVTPDGAILNDSMAIAEELASRHPDIPFWPTDPLARGTARALANEMHSSFGGLRSNWAVNLRQTYAPMSPPADIVPELERLETLWTHARTVTKAQGHWLCGEYSLVDAIFAPMAVRLAGYGFHTRPTSKAYVNAHLTDPALRRWRAMGLAKGIVMPGFEIDADVAPWPGPTSPPGTPVRSGPSENTACPYSGDPVTHFMQLDGHVFGFCNAFCRDKTSADPGAWSKFQAIYQPIVNHTDGQR